MCDLQELQNEAQQLLGRQHIPWLSLQSITLELRRVSAHSKEQWLHVLCQGSQLVLSTPPKREKSKELQERLTKLQEQVDQASYNRMVSDVTKGVSQC